MFPRKELKRDMKLAVERRRGESLITTLVFLIIYGSLYSLGGVVSVNLSELQLDDMLLFIFAVILLFFALIGITMQLFTLPVFIQGYRLYARSIADHRIGSVKTIFIAFRDYWRIVKLNLWISLFVFLWSLLFIIPGIIAVYRYRFAFYILMDHPECTAKEALCMSKELTKGFKWDLFVMDLSFLGWNILCGLTLGILSLWIMPYQYTTEAEAYKYISYVKNVKQY